MMRSLPLLLLLMMVAGCKPTVPSEYIQPDDMADILYDYHVAQAMGRSAQGGNADIERTRLFAAVLRKHEVTEADFDSSMVYYHGHLDRLKRIYTRVNGRLADEAKNLGASVAMRRYSQYGTTGDTANIWTEASEVLLMPRPTMNRYDFSVKVDSTFHLGDSFMMQFMSDFIFLNGSKDATVCVVTKYEGDSITQSVTHVSTSGISQLRVPANTERKLKELRGFIYLARDGGQGDTRKLMFISQIQLVRFHNKNIQPPHETNTAGAATVQADSVQRGDDARGERADTTRAATLSDGLRSKTAPFKRRGAAH